MASASPFREGVMAAVPIWIAFVPFSFALGVAAETHGLSLGEVVLMSALVYAGPAQFAALKDDGYEGFCSLETHWRPVALSEEEIKRPGGAAYSESGEYASRICLANINAIVAALA